MDLTESKSESSHRDRLVGLAACLRRHWEGECVKMASQHRAIAACRTVGRTQYDSVALPCLFQRYKGVSQN